MMWPREGACGQLGRHILPGWLHCKEDQGSFGFYLSLGQASAAVSLSSPFSVVDPCQRFVGLLPRKRAVEDTVPLDVTS